MVFLFEANQYPTYITKFHVLFRNPIETEVRGQKVDDADDGVLLAEDPGRQPGDGHAGVTVHLPEGGGGVRTEAQVGGAEVRREEVGEEGVEQVWEVMFGKPSGGNANINHNLNTSK